MKKTFRQYRLLASSSLLALPMIASPALAQDSDSRLQDIVVTAQKRAENLQSTPLAISAANKEMLEQRGVVDVTGVNLLAPNVNVSPSLTTAGQISVFIRNLGQPETSASVDGPVTLYLDGVPIGRLQGAMFDLVDLERVEVLRGPQGTLYGRNTIGGAVNFITARPSKDFGFEQRFTGGNFNRIESRTRVDTGELGDSGLSAKLAYIHKQHDGYIRNTLQPRKSKWPGSENVDGGRFVLNYDKGGAIRATYSADYQEQHAVKLALQTTAATTFAMVGATNATDYYSQSPSLGGGPFVVSPTRLKTLTIDNEGPDTTKVQGHTLNLEGDLSDNIVLRSITGYRKIDYNTPGVNNTGNGLLRGRVLDFLTGLVSVQPVSPFFLSANSTRQHQFSEEINLIGNALDHKLDYVLGGFHFSEKAFQDQPQNFTAVIAPGVGFNGGQTLSSTSFSKSNAAFGQATYHFTDELEFTGGIRYTADKRRLVQTVGGASQSVKYEKLNWAGSLSYKFTPDIMAYGRIASGYRAGGFNANTAGGTIPASFAPESVINYEAGIKSEFLDRHLRVNLGYYYMDYKDLQIGRNTVTPAGLVFGVFNAGKARYQGFEAEMQAVFGGLSLTGNLGTSKRKYIQYLTFDSTTNTIINIGPQVVGTTQPRLTANLGAQYAFPEMSFGTFSARVDWNYRTKQYFDQSFFQKPFEETIASKAYGLFDARITLDDVKLAGGAIKISAWAKNLTDKVYRAQGLELSALGVGTNAYGPPRTIGLDVSFKY